VIVLDEGEMTEARAFDPERLASRAGADFD
jgi:hypothetical protein